MVKTAVTIVEFVPSFLNGWTAYLEENKDVLPPLPDLQWIMMVGEDVPVSLVNRWLALYPDTRVLNGYGPCEASDDIAQYAMRAPLEPFRKKVPIGQPLANLAIFILNKRAQLLPLGAIGEICVSGVAVGAGYWNKPANTARSFIHNPYPGTPGEVIYKTGDMGRWLPDGNLEFWGRADNQVKIRGFRVETGEIEAVISLHKAVKEVAVVVNEQADGEKELAAFLVLEHAGRKEHPVKNVIAAVREHCIQKLPAYMVPAQLRAVDEIILNLSGKVDRKKMLTFLEEQAEEDNSYLPPETDTEFKLAALWQTVLKRDQVGICDNFFAIGGHSLKATQIISKIYKMWGVNLRLSEIFNNPTIKQLAGVIDHAGKGAVHGISAAECQDYYGLSHAQQRLWFLDRLQEGDTVYNITSAYIFHGLVNKSAFNQAFHILIDRHEALRTSFHSLEGRPVQRIHAMQDINFQVEHISLQHLPDSERRADEIAEQVTALAFDLEQVPLLRAKLVQLATGKYLFLFTMHHIISDGWSAEVLQQEFFTIYASLENDTTPLLTPLKLQYRDFVRWHNRMDFSGDEKYWLDRLSDKAPLISLPYDYEPLNKDASAGAVITAPVSISLLQQLKHIATRKGTSLSNICFTVFNILLYNISGQKQLQVGVAVANRNHPDLETLLGFFVNVMVIRTVLSEDTTFEDALQQVTDNMTAAYDHQNYPFDLLVSKLNPDRNSEQPLFNVMYAYQNYAGIASGQQASENAPQEVGFSVEPYDSKAGTAKFDLTLFVFDQEGTMSLALEYKNSLFKETTARSILDSYIEFLEYASAPKVLAVM